MTAVADRTFRIKQGDTGPTLVERLRNADGTIPDLTDATITFRLARGNGTLVVEATATVLDPVGAVVSYVWAAGDTDLDGEFFRAWRVVLPSSEIVTFPNDRLGDEVEIAPEGG